MKTLVFLLSLCLLAPTLMAESLYKIDFTEITSGHEDQWLHLSNFDLQQDAKDRLKPTSDERGLVLNIGEDWLGGMVQRIDQPKAKKLKIVWGVDKYPAAANWDIGQKREAALVSVAFGVEMKDSGAYLLPKIPYFVGIFLGQNEKADKWYKGNYYQESGAYICTPCGSALGAEVTSVIDLDEAFRANFPNAGPRPPISALGISFDTRPTGNIWGSIYEKIFPDKEKVHSTDYAKVWIRSIEFLSE